MENFIVCIAITVFILAVVKIIRSASPDEINQAKKMFGLDAASQSENKLHADEAKDKEFQFETGTGYLKEIDDEESRESMTYNPMYDAYNIYRHKGL